MKRKYSLAASNSLLSILFFLLISVGFSLGLSNSALAKTTANGAKLKPNQLALHGVVNNKNGPATQGQVEIFDKSGQSIAVTEIAPDSAYHVGIEKNSQYPLTLKATFTDKTDGKEKQLKSFILKQTTDPVDITMYTDKVVEIAGKLGGLSESNVARARIYAMMSIPGGGGGGGGHAGHGHGKH